MMAKRKALALLATLFLALVAGSAWQLPIAAEPVVTATGDGDGNAGTSERLYVGTGTFDPAEDRHGILRFENAESLDSRTAGPYTPDAIIPIKQTFDRFGVRLFFAHGLYLVESRDEMYVASILTNASNSDGPFGPSDETGSIGVIANASEANGPQTLVRHIFGSNTQILLPHGVWVDETRDLLYVASPAAGNVLVFENASTVDGNIAPSRVIDHAKMGQPFFVFIDEAANRLFVASVDDGTPSAPEAALLIYNNASTLDGNVEPNVRIIGPNTRLEVGGDTTHNVWYDSTTQLLFAAHRTNEILIFDLSTIDLSPASAMDYNLSPRVIKINEDPTDADVRDWKASGLFYIPEEDRLYVSADHPAPVSQAIKVYDDVSDPSVSGMVTPTQVIHWANGRYYSPQPLWVTRLKAGLPGDVDKDGDVDVFDALAILNALVGIEPLEFPDNGDVNGDGTTNIFDALAVLGIVVSAP